MKLVSVDLQGQQAFPDALDPLERLEAEVRMEPQVFQEQLVNVDHQVRLDSPVHQEKGAVMDHQDK